VPEDPDVQGSIDALRQEGERAIAAAADAGELEDLRIAHLGRKAELTAILRGIGELPAEQRGPVGSAANAAREVLEGMLERRRSELEAEQLESGLAAERVDVTLPGTPALAVGSQNLLVRTLREIEDIFCGLGYLVMEGPEVELDYYNFTALNHPPGHPARMAQDTFYVDPQTLDPDLRLAPAPALPGEPAEGPALPPGPEDVVLRTHTSPMQVRAM
jgi:phenylalanyl-tRNA synthetase alpha chain